LQMNLMVKPLPMRAGEEDMVEQAFSAAGHVLAILAVQEAGAMSCEVLFASVLHATNAIKAFGGIQWFLKRKVPSQLGLIVQQCPWSENVMRKAAKRVWISRVSIDIDILRVHSIFSAAIGRTFDDKWGYQKEGPKSICVFFELVTAEDASNASASLIRLRRSGTVAEISDAVVAIGEQMMHQDPQPIWSPTLADDSVGRAQFIDDRNIGPTRANVLVQPSAPGNAVQPLWTLPPDTPLMAPRALPSYAFAQPHPQSQHNFPFTHSGVAAVDDRNFDPTRTHVLVQPSAPGNAVQTHWTLPPGTLMMAPRAPPSYTFAPSHPHSQGNYPFTLPGVTAAPGSQFVFVTKQFYAPSTQIFYPGPARGGPEA